MLDGSSGLAAALLLAAHCMTLRIASTLCDGLGSAALSSALGGVLKELALVLAPDVGVRTRGQLLGALESTVTGLEVLEMRLECTSDEVRGFSHSRIISMLYLTDHFGTVCVRNYL